MHMNEPACTNVCGLNAVKSRLACAMAKRAKFHLNTTTQYELRLV